jgi:hypothetical protein
MPKKRFHGLLAVVAGALCGSPAAAAGEQGPGTVYSVEDYPTALVDRPLTLPGGMFQVNLPVKVNLSNGSVGQPVSVPLGVSYGVTPDIQLDGFTTTGFCLSGDTNGCPRLLDDAGARVVASLLRDASYQLVASAGIDILKISDPSAVAAQVGVGAKWGAGFFAANIAAFLNIGLNNRDAPVNINEVLAPPNIHLSNRNLGNKDVLAVSAQPQFQLCRLFAVYFIAGLAGRLDSFSDSFVIPLGAGLIFVPNPYVDMGVEFAFDNLLGKNSNADFRTGRAFASLRF